MKRHALLTMQPVNLLRLQQEQRLAIYDDSGYRSLVTHVNRSDRLLAIEPIPELHSGFPIVLLYYLLVGLAVSFFVIVCYILYCVVFKRQILINENNVDDADNCYDIVDVASVVDNVNDAIDLENQSIDERTVQMLRMRALRKRVDLSSLLV
jgi:hypothetical protein